MIAYDENSLKTLTTDFPFHELDCEALDAKEEAMEMACEAAHRVWEWIYQPACKDLDGFTCRCIVACWVFVPMLRGYSMTDIASRFGKHKQSLGRWVDDFKLQFPEVAKHLAHLRHEQH